MKIIIDLFDDSRLSITIMVLIIAKSIYNLMYHLDAQKGKKKTVEEQNFDLFPTILTFEHSVNSSFWSLYEVIWIYAPLNLTSTYSIIQPLLIDYSPAPPTGRCCHFHWFMLRKQVKFFLGQRIYWYYIIHISRSPPSLPPIRELLLLPNRIVHRLQKHKTNKGKCTVFEGRIRSPEPYQFANPSHLILTSKIT